MIVRRLVMIGLAATSVSPPSRSMLDASPFALCVSRGGAVEGVPPFATPTVLHAVYRSLTLAQRLELTAALDEAVSRREAQLNPFAADLEDGAPDDRLLRFFDSAPVTFGTARLLLASRYCGTDGFCVRVTDGACGLGERSPEGEEIPRARFLAWPYAYAHRVTVTNDRAVKEQISALQRSPDVALVLSDGPTADDAEEVAVQALFARREALERVAAGGTRSETKIVETPPAHPTARAVRHDGLLTREPERELLVIPTLGAFSARMARE